MKLTFFAYQNIDTIICFYIPSEVPFCWKLKLV